MSLYDVKMPSLKDKIREEAERLQEEIDKKKEKEEREVMKDIKPVKVKVGIKNIKKNK